MRHYEVIFIVSPSFDDEKAAARAREIIEQIEQIGSKIHYSEFWGRRKLAYEVKKQRFGYYMMCHIECDNTVLAEVERSLKLIEDVLKFMIVRLEEDKLGKDSPLKVEKVREREEV